MTSLVYHHAEPFQFLGSTLNLYAMNLAPFGLLFQLIPGHARLLILVLAAVGRIRAAPLAGQALLVAAPLLLALVFGLAPRGRELCIPCNMARCCSCPLSSGLASVCNTFAPYRVLPGCCCPDDWCGPASRGRSSCPAKVRCALPPVWLQRGTHACVGQSMHICHVSGV